MHLHNFSEPVSYTLTVLCAVTGVVVILLFRYHRMQTNNLQLGAEPSGIATVAALLSGSSIPGRLQPAYDVDTIRRELDVFRFKLQPDGRIDVTERGV